MGKYSPPESPENTPPKQKEPSTAMTSKNNQLGGGLHLGRDQQYLIKSVDSNSVESFNNNNRRGLETPNIITNIKSSSIQKKPDANSRNSSRMQAMISEAPTVNISRKPSFERKTNMVDSYTQCDQDIFFEYIMDFLKAVEERINTFGLFQHKNVGLN